MAKGCKSCQFSIQIRSADGAGKLHAHEKQAGVVVVVLGRFLDVAAALQQETRDGMHDARTVRAREGEDVGRVHISAIVEKGLLAVVHCSSCLFRRKMS